MIDRPSIRNFCIIAHIDHGKSTLADRFLEFTRTVEKRKMKSQILDQMEIERERGITIKLQPVRMYWKTFEFNLIDTPGHVDFTYEVSRSMAAVEGAILLVDATQGVQAQTVANVYLALEENLSLIPVINKIDLPNAQIEQTKKELKKLFGFHDDEIFLISAKTGEGVEKLLDAIPQKIPAPNISEEKPLRALIFDSSFDDYKGVIASVRIFDGKASVEDPLFFAATKKHARIGEVGYFSPELKPTKYLRSGEIGYIATGLKDLHQCRVGDTICGQENLSPVKGYRDIQPMVFAGIFCKEGGDYENLKRAIERLALNDASLKYEPEHSSTLGSGFRCGFLGLLHLEIVQQRLLREYKIPIIVTSPSIVYRVTKKNGEKILVKTPADLPPPEFRSEIEEPYMKMDIFSPKKYLGAIMQFVAEKRGIYKNTEYFDEYMAVLHYEIPLASIIIDFYDGLKSLSSGYASLNYTFLEFRPCDIVKLDILIAQHPVEALSVLVYRDEAYKRGRTIVEKLKASLPRQQFVVKIQAAVGGKIIAAEHLPALRKDVTAKLYGGDYLRKKKLLEKQKKGKKKMMAKGRVDIPPDVFISLLKRE